MLLNPDDFEQARQARDPHFDGRFFIGVLTTGIYCRPICPVRIPKKENIQIYSTAAAAAEAGFRPCLRCRPESSPGTPAWMGSSHTVSRALQLIARGVLNECSVETLAAQLGVGSRQLTRLFEQHLGVSPAAVASTQRLHFAKKLIDETTLSMGEICFAAGFSSVRRFNAVFQQVYGRAPLSLRRHKELGETLQSGAGQGVQIRLNYRPPFDWRAMLAYLAMRAIPGVEHVTSDTYSRTIVLNGDPGDISVRFIDESHSLLLTIRSTQTRSLYHIVERVRMMFDLKAVSTEIESFLAEDSHLRPIVAANPGIRVPVAWDGFEVAVRAIVGQQVSVKGATTLVSRFAKACGVPYSSGADPQLNLIFPTPQAVMDASLSGLGLTTRRIEAIQNLAAVVCAGELRFDGGMTTEEFVERITRIPGIGPWTAQYIALRALNDPDAFPHADLILLRAAAADGETLTPGQLLIKAERWRPWRAYVVMLFWRHYAQQISPPSA
ncbi:MAG: AlkA N-terminal domain-containing protein [Gammaproteobacteria bacterium]|nr:AlkA N-terminal domain-containing protein [Gammaproteobacteria bacterium]MDP2140453.1 AlkA N-terminal domain-containing protein [Gammaproteobacteria bacterium]MDP2349492.1 AlkA N-terminal domain-containing protein [Gammaproteobacteria bacterium]